MKTVTIGIMPSDEFEQRMLNIAAGRYKPCDDEPKIWFSSLRSMAEVLSENNMKVLELIEEMKPDSLKALAELSGRKPSNLSRTLKTLEQYGIIKLEKHHKQIKPMLSTTHFKAAKTPLAKYGTITLSI